MSSTTTTDTDDGTVRITTCAGYGSGIYHTDPTCRRWPEEGRDISIDEADRRQMRECSFCSGDAGQGGAPSNKYLQRLDVSVNGRGT